MRDGRYTSPDDYICDLIRRDQERAEDVAVREAVLDALVEDACLIDTAGFRGLEAIARHAIYGGQWRRLDRRALGLSRAVSEFDRPPSSPWA